jgi:hypothetical protein
MENDISHDETKPAAIKWGLQRQVTELIGTINGKMTGPHYILLLWTKV